MAKWADDAAWLVINNFSSGNIVGLGCEELKQEWLPKMAAGEKIRLHGRY
jgi:alkylation response protein AidB-like acyl-CoA dehydrogenase